MITRSGRRSKNSCSPRLPSPTAATPRPARPSTVLARLREASSDSTSSTLRVPAASVIACTEEAHGRVLNTHLGCNQLAACRDPSDGRVSGGVEPRAVVS